MPCAINRILLPRDTDCLFPHRGDAGRFPASGPTAPTSGRSLPPVEFQYSDATVADEVRDADPDSLANLPGGVPGSRYQWLDLDGDGLPGVLVEEDNGWYYKRNVSAGTFVQAGAASHPPGWSRSPR